VTSRRWVEAVVLEGSLVRLEPLGPEHLAGLIDIGLEADIWRWMPIPIQTPGEMRAWLDSSLEAAEQGSEMPFATIVRDGDKVVGSTRYMNIEPRHRRLEIGYTWINPQWQRSAVNSEAKLLMLRHAFDTLGALRVEFKTDSLNERSRAALLGIGATEEGTMRNHMVTQSERRRHSVYFSIIEEEWPRVRQQLEARLARHASAASTPSAEPSAEPSVPDPG
jgi:RimJ/RimL family protein N-acetyltransferase